MVVKKVGMVVKKEVVLKVGEAEREVAVKVEGEAMDLVQDETEVEREGNSLVGENEVAKKVLMKEATSVKKTGYNVQMQDDRKRRKIVRNRFYVAYTHYSFLTN